MRIAKFKPGNRNSAATGVLFDSLGDVFKTIKDAQRAGKFTPGSWGCSDQAIARLETGQQSLVARSDKLMDMLETGNLIDYSGRETIRTVSGGLADVPAYLAGSPVNMRCRVRRETPRPLRIVVDVTSSANIRDETLERRGVAVLALLRKLEASNHAVELYTVEAPGDYSSTHMAYTRLDTSPMDLARACWALASAEFSRETVWSAMDTASKYRVGGSWPWGGHDWHTSLANQQETHAGLLGVEREGLFVLGCLYNTDAAQPFVTDKKAADWIAERYSEAVAMAAGV